MINVIIHTQIPFLLNEGSTQIINTLKITQCRHFHTNKMVTHKIILSTTKKILIFLHNNNLWDNYSHLITKICLIILKMTNKFIFWENKTVIYNEPSWQWDIKFSNWDRRYRRQQNSKNGKVDFPIFTLINKFLLSTQD